MYPTKLCRQLQEEPPRVYRNGFNTDPWAGCVYRNRLTPFLRRRWCETARFCGGSRGGRALTDCIGPTAGC